MLRADIIDGTIPAGTRLKEEVIASRFGVSREMLAASLAAEAHGGDQGDNLRAVVERGRRAGEAGQSTICPR